MASSSLFRGLPAVLVRSDLQKPLRTVITHPFPQIWGCLTLSRVVGSLVEFRIEGTGMCTPGLTVSGSHAAAGQTQGASLGLPAYDSALWKVTAQRVTVTALFKIQFCPRHWNDISALIPEGAVGLVFFLSPESPFFMLGSFILEMFFKYLLVPGQPFVLRTRTKVSRKQLSGVGRTSL